MDDVHYVQAADLHLDAPYRGLDIEAFGNNNLRMLLRGSTFNALDRLVNFCGVQKPDFLIIAGDAYNDDEHSVKARLALWQACRRLDEINIPVFIAHGNHDPLSFALKTLQWPKNTHIFGIEPEKKIVEKNGRPLAVVHGVSYETNREERNLARLFQRDHNFDCFQIGVLHCAATPGKNSDGCAPCSLEDLRASGLDAWALGHEHKRAILCERPFIAYPGNIQGLSISESGPKGCLSVKAVNTDSRWVCKPDFKQLAQVCWQQIEVNLDDLNDLAGFFRKFEDEIDQARNRAGNEIDAILIRARLTGRTELDGVIRQKDFAASIKKRFGDFSSGTVGIWIKDIEIETSGPTAPEEFLSRNDLMGQLARLASDLRGNGAEMEALARETLAPVINACGGDLESFDGERLKKIMTEAERVCLRMLEKR